MSKMKKESDPDRPTMRRGKCPRWPEDWIYKDYCERCGRCDGVGARAWRSSNKAGITNNPAQPQLNRIGGVERRHATVQAVVPDVAQCAPGTIGNLTALPKDEPVSSPARSDTEGG